MVEPEGRVEVPEERLKMAMIHGTNFSRSISDWNEEIDV